MTFFRHTIATFSKINAIFAVLFVRKSVELYALFVRKSVPIYRFFVNKSVVIIWKGLYIQSLSCVGLWRLFFKDSKRKLGIGKYQYK